MQIKEYTLNKYSLDDRLEILHDEISYIYSNTYNFKYDPSRKSYQFKDLVDCNILYVYYEDDNPVAFLIGKYIENIMNKYTGLYIVETATLNKYQHRGINKRIREYSIKKLNPNIIYGEVNNPISAKSRVSITEANGYTTYWLEKKISTNSDINNIEEITKESIKIFNNEVSGRYQNGIVPYLVWDSAIPIEENNIFPEYDDIFKRLQKYSKEVYKSCLGILISVKETC